MPTPESHKETAEAFFVRLTHPGLIPANDADHLVAIAHAHLSTAAGTGTHYAAAEALLEALPEDWKGREQAAQQATVHAILAER